MLYHSHTESIAGHTSGGFGSGGLMVFGCGCLPSKLLTPLYKETYLLEFETATDKAIVKMNLGIQDSEDLALLKNLIIAEVLKEINKGGSGTGSGSEQKPDDNPGTSGENGFDMEEWGQV